MDPTSDSPTAEASWLGIDYGARRIGLAHADELGVPIPLEAAVETTAEQRFDHIARVIREKKVRVLVLGYPTRLDGTAGPIAKEVEGFRDELVRRFALPVHLTDERSTSQDAGEHWSLRKSRRRRGTGQIDSAAATLILRDYLELLPQPQPPMEPPF